MRSIKRIRLCIILLTLIIFVTSCGGGNKITGDSKETQIKKSFAKTLEMYPIKNLEDLYDKEGYRDGEFKKGDKGTWTISTDFAKSNKQGEMNSEGMVLHFNRNTRTATGYYTVRTTYDEVDKLTREKNTVLNLKTIR